MLALPGRVGDLDVEALLREVPLLLGDVGADERQVRLRLVAGHEVKLPERRGRPCSESPQAARARRSAAARAAVAPNRLATRWIMIEPNHPRCLQEGAVAAATGVSGPGRQFGVAQQAAPGDQALGRELEEPAPAGAGRFAGGVEAGVAGGQLGLDLGPAVAAGIVHFGQRAARQHPT